MQTHFAVPAARRSPIGADLTDEPSTWQQWLQQPQRLWLHKALFQIHFWIGAVAGLYLALMSVTGSIIVYRNELSRWTSVQWLVDLHTNLLFGSTGRSQDDPSIRIGGSHEGPRATPRRPGVPVVQKQGAE